MSDDKKMAENGAARAGATPPEMPPGTQAADTPAQLGEAQFKEIILALQGELEKKAAEAASKHEQLLRIAAEADNVRRRLEKEKEETARYAITKFAKDILTVGDNFQRAISAVPKDAVESDPALKTLLDGVVLAERDFRSALERHGVMSIDPAGQPFNPHHHQAVMEKENSDVPSGTVLQVFQIGYLINDRCLRPAMVVVSRGGPKAQKAEPTVTPRQPEPATPQSEAAADAEDQEPPETGTSRTV